MRGDCAFYHTVQRRAVSNEIRSDQQIANVQVVEVPWCSHKHSPVSRLQATGAVFIAGALHCNGELDKCQVPREKFEDFQ